MAKITNNNLQNTTYSNLKIEKYKHLLLKQGWIQEGLAVSVPAEAPAVQLMWQFWW
jgi:hypothetical protein